jgi:hypothetical protein
MGAVFAAGRVFYMFFMVILRKEKETYIKDEILTRESTNPDDASIYNSFSLFVQRRSG